MKRILAFLTIAATVLFISCEAGEDDAPPSGNGTVEVHVTYTGATISKAAGPGSGNIYVILLNDAEITDYRPPQTLTPAYYTGTSSPAVKNTEYTLTITNVPAGDYYVLLLYDVYEQPTKLGGTNDVYALYNSTSTITSCNENADSITVASGNMTSLTGISFSDAYKLQSSLSGGTSTGGSYIECP